MGFEPTTPTLARLCSTPELHPHPSNIGNDLGEIPAPVKSADGAQIVRNTFPRRSDPPEKQTAAPRRGGAVPS